MSLISPGSISLDSTFKGHIQSLLLNTCVSSSWARSFRLMKHIHSLILNTCMSFSWSRSLPDWTHSSPHLEYENMHGLLLSTSIPSDGTNSFQPLAYMHDLLLITLIPSGETHSFLPLAYMHELLLRKSSSFPLTKHIYSILWNTDIGSLWASGFPLTVRIHSLLMNTVHAWAVSPSWARSFLRRNTFIPSSCIDAWAPLEPVHYPWRNTFIPSS